jgi:hypothetical protein
MCSHGGYNYIMLQCGWESPALEKQVIVWISREFDFATLVFEVFYWRVNPIYCIFEVDLCVLAQNGLFGMKSQTQSLVKLPKREIFY